MDKADFLNRLDHIEDSIDRLMSTSLMEDDRQHSGSSASNDNAALIKYLGRFIESEPQNNAVTVSLPAKKKVVSKATAGFIKMLNKAAKNKENITDLVSRIQEVDISNPDNQKLVTRLTNLLEEKTPLSQIQLRNEAEQTKMINGGMFLMLISLLLTILVAPMYKGAFQDMRKLVSNFEFDRVIILLGRLSAIGLALIPAICGICMIYCANQPVYRNDGTIGLLTNFGIDICNFLYKIISQADFIDNNRG